MNYHKEELESKNLDHLGIIAGIIDEIGIVEKFNEILLIDSREKVNTGQIVKAIALKAYPFGTFCMLQLPKGTWGVNWQFYILNPLSSELGANSVCFRAIALR